MMLLYLFVLACTSTVGLQPLADASLAAAAYIDGFVTQYFHTSLFSDLNSPGLVLDDTFKVRSACCSDISSLLLNV